MTPKIGYTLIATLPEVTAEGSKHYGLSLCQANINQGIVNLIAIFMEASDNERLHGLEWFGQSYADCVELSQLYDLPLDYVIDCVAVVSPQLAWNHNIYSAEVIIRYFKGGSFVPSYTDYLAGRIKLVDSAKLIDLPIGANVTGANKVKALWILQGQKWALKGRKVESFADNIRRFEQSDLVTVDSHAISAWFGCVLPQSVTVTPSFYGIIEADYRKVASMFGVSPLECQAIIWIVKRRLSGSDRRAKEVKKVNRD